MSKKLPSPEVLAELPYTNYDYSLVVIVVLIEGCCLACCIR